eukprot:CAMPEP_0170500526 /NCGR_PEP_ID=MMETSP0208-20121228/35173_1 /TAXON_ID=197538 /ORGANISM="Strombidium inclinatum, Strain S3" /LENGTH=66 /DNA_ID=CAMNT_0010778609 /DNA_START=41 /DNA_END=238 /DNA_ORIENTATION=+
MATNYLNRRTKSNHNISDKDTDLQVLSGYGDLNHPQIPSTHSLPFPGNLTSRSLLSQKQSKARLSR